MRNIRGKEKNLNQGDTHLPSGAGLCLEISETIKIIKKHARKCQVVNYKVDDLGDCCKQ